MKKKYVPDILASSVYDVPVSFYVGLGIKTILSDLDNTLAPHAVKVPDERTIAWAKQLREAGIDLYIASNNTGKRVRKFAQVLGAESACWLFKPFAAMLKRFLRKHNIDRAKALMIGDQVVTDIACGNSAGLRTMLVEHLSPEIPVFTKVNKRRDDRLRKTIREQGLSRDWREYEQTQHR